MNEGDELPIRIVAAAQLSRAKGSPAEPQNAAQTQPKHTYKGSANKPVEQSTTSRKASKQESKTVNTTPTSPKATTLGTYVVCLPKAAGA
jgi:hypothetical protein